MSLILQWIAIIDQMVIITLLLWIVLLLREKFQK